MQSSFDREYGQDFNTTILLLDPGSDEPSTGKVDTDIYVTVFDPVTGSTNPLSPDIVLVEIDSANAPGLYSLTVVAAVLNDTETTQAVCIHPVSALDFQPVLFTLNNVPVGWHAFFVSFSEVFTRIQQLASLQGVR